MHLKARIKPNDGIYMGLVVVLQIEACSDADLKNAPTSQWNHFLTLAPYRAYATGKVDQIRQKASFVPVGAYGVTHFGAQRRSQVAPEASDLGDQLKRIAGPDVLSNHSDDNCDKADNCNEQQNACPTWHALPKGKFKTPRSE